MQTIRRLYLYIVAGASLGMLVVGLANIGGILLELLLAGGALGSTLRESLAVAIAVTLVGLPVWAIHWVLAQRQARSDTLERSATLRRLYLYLATSIFMLSSLVLGNHTLYHLLGPALTPDTRFDGLGLARTTWQLILVFVFWAYHFRVTAADRAAVGEQDGSATLRRWYAYGFRLIGLLTLLFGARELLRFILLSLVSQGDVVRPGGAVASTISLTVAATAVWLFHTRWTDRSILAEDERCTQRTVEGFIALALAVGFTLFDASQALYYALARLLGVAEPGGVRGNILSALVNPVSTVVVFGTAWWLVQRRLRIDASRTEVERQAGVRRLYTHLVALFALFTFAAGVVWVLITLSDQLTGAQLVKPEAWRDQLSLALTLIAVGLPMWLTHWRPQPALVERLTLSRRMYIFASLLISVLSLLGSAAVFLYRVLSLVLQLSSTQSPTVDMGRALAVSLVAAGVGAYHWRVLRLDNALREHATAEESAVAAAPVPTFLVEITGATDGEIRAALAQLPSVARYELHTQPTERGTPA